MGKLHKIGKANHTIAIEVGCRLSGDCKDHRLQSLDGHFDGVRPGLAVFSYGTVTDGTAQREAVRRWHLGTVLPLARILDAELSEKLEAEVRLTFDAYPLDPGPGALRRSRSL